FAQQHGIPIRALNAPPDLIRSVSRSGGVTALAPEQRAQLPADLVVDDPLYERVTNLQLAIHMAVDPAKLRPMFEAQMARDETMAAGIVAARRGESGITRTAFVVIGAGHMRYGLGTPAGVRRRVPGIIERLILISESGHYRITDAEKAASREMHIAHSDLRAIGRAPADYLRLLPVSTSRLPPGHPPVGGGEK
ncbi:MAG: ChaN family lipoprotein, partial [Opitutaceae bacterium]